MKVQNNEIFIIIEYLLNNLIFEMFLYDFYFNKIRKHR